MSDSVPDPKVEDVLSSVRRLVSGEIPRKSRAPLPKGPGALVLTNAHRVAKDPLSRKSGRSLEDRIAELEAAVDDGTDEFEPDGSEDQAQNTPNRIVYTRPPTSEEEDDVRRSTLRLSELALIPTGPANETEDEDINLSSIPFRHDSKEKQAVVEKVKGLIGDNGAPADGPQLKPFEAAPDSDGTEVKDDGIAEAPMAVDVPTMPPRRADVSVFSNPDDFVERIAARIDRGEEDATDVAIVRDPHPDVDDIKADAEENMLRFDIDATDEDETEAEFDAALSEAVEASVTATVHEELANADLSGDHDAEDVLVLPQDLPVLEMEDLDLEAAGMTEFSSDPDTFVADREEQWQEQSSSAPMESDGSNDEAATDTTDQADLVPAAILADDDALKAQVAILIRQELQGELGERITRNVRKLVRREIKRVLEARDIV
ncbi:hypothetical protein N9C96_00215 [bacterium]|nr:hypothetical protein [bacterium]